MSSVTSHSTQNNVTFLITICKALLPAPCLSSACRPALSALWPSPMGLLQGLCICCSSSWQMCKALVPQVSAYTPPHASLCIFSLVYLKIKARESVRKRQHLTTIEVT